MHASPTPVDRDRNAARALWVVVGLAAVVLFYVNRHQWFGGDEWFILTDRGLTAGPGHQGLFEPHYEHWTTVPILAFRALYSIVGLHSYLPYIALVIVAHLAAVVLLWHVMVRSRIDAWVALCFVTVFAVLGTGFENLENAWQVTLVAPLALGLAAILVVPESGPFARARRDRGRVHDDRDDVLGCRAPDAPRGGAHRVRATRMACGDREPRWYRRPRTRSGISRTAVTVRK